MIVAFETELEELRSTYQSSLDMLKEEIRFSLRKQAALMSTVSQMAMEIAKRDLIIEKLCTYIEQRDNDIDAVAIARHSREAIQL